MKMYSMANASREFARWRTLLRADGSGPAPSRAAVGAPAFEDTECEWARTEWSETLPVDDALDLDLVVRT